MAEKTKAVLLGCGRISRVWVDAALQMDDLELVGFVDLQADAAAARAEQYGNPDALVSTDLEAALDQTQPEIVFNCTVPQVHAETSQIAMRHGAHVLVEKPLADSLAGAQQMIATAESSGKVLAVLQNRRYQPQIRRLRALLASGEIGALTTINSDFYVGAHFGGFRDHMEHILLIDMAIHTFDQARFISGADALSVYCQEWNPAGSWYDQDASAIAIFEMSNGLVYCYRGSWCSEGLHTSWESDWRIIGESGTVRWDGQNLLEAQCATAGDGLVRPGRDLEIPAEVPAEKVGSHAACIREFVDSLRNGSRPETIATDNINSLAMCLGAIESASSGRRVEIRV